MGRLGLEYIFLFLKQFVEGCFIFTLEFLVELKLLRCSVCGEALYVVNVYFTCLAVLLEVVVGYVCVGVYEVYCYEECSAGEESAKGKEVFWFGPYKLYDKRHEQHEQEYDERCYVKPESGEAVGVYVER